LAAIVNSDKGLDVDGLLRRFVAVQVGKGRTIGGLLQTSEPRASGGKKRFFLDLRSGESFSISQDLGPSSQSCSVDTAGVAQASAVLRQALADRVDLAVVNRFGELEAAGGGFAAEILALADAGIPVLTVSAHRHLDAWRTFCGEYGIELRPLIGELDAWFDRVIERT
jgi:hypothetical protein